MLQLICQYQFKNNLQKLSINCSNPQMLYDNSFTKQPQDYLMNFIKNKMEHRLKDDSQEQNQNNFRIERNIIDEQRDHNEGSDDHQDRYYSYEDDESNKNKNTQWQQSNYFNLDKQYKDEEVNELTQQIQPSQSCDDSFLDIVDQHLSHLKKQSNTEENNITINEVKRETISLSKQEISHCLLSNQTTLDSIQLTNLSPTQSIANIINSPFQFIIINAKNKFIKKDQVQILLQPFQSVEIQFEVKKRQSDQIGNIYETLKIDYCCVDNDKNKQMLQSKFVKFQITFVKPKLEVTFLGRTMVKRIQEHKIAHLNVYPNEMNQYFINLIFSQQQFSTLNSTKLQRIQCQIQSKGYLSVHPNSIILYQNQPIKIVLRRLTQVSGVGRTSVVLIKPVNSSLTYVIGIKCMERKDKVVGQENTYKMNKFML